MPEIKTKRHPAIPKLYEYGGRNVPDGARVEVLTTRDGVDIRAARFAAKTADTRGTILLVQGRAEFIEKYYDLIEELRAEGFAVATFDLRGQGGSERLTRNRYRGHVNRFDDYGRDLDTVIEGLLLADCPPPYFAVGHSTGGAVLLHAADRLKTRIERFVLTAPLMGLANQTAEFLAEVIAPPLAWIGLGRLVFLTTALRPVIRRGQPFLKPDNPHRLTSDPAQQAALLAFAEAHPELMTGPTTFGWINAMNRSNAALARPPTAERLSIPTIIATAGEETLVSNAAIDRFAQRMRIGRAITLDSARHEIPHELPALRERFVALATEFFVLNDTVQWDL